MDTSHTGKSEGGWSTGQFTTDVRGIVREHEVSVYPHTTSCTSQGRQSTLDEVTMTHGRRRHVALVRKWYIRTCQEALPVARSSQETAPTFDLHRTH